MWSNIMDMFEFVHRGHWHMETGVQQRQGTYQGLTLTTSMAELLLKPQWRPSWAMKLPLFHLHRTIRVISSKVSHGSHATVRHIRAGMLENLVQREPSLFFYFIYTFHKFWQHFSLWWLFTHVHLLSTEVT